MPTTASFLWKLLPVLLWCIGDNAWAQPPQTVAVGAGSQSCGEWISAQERDSKSTGDAIKSAMLLSWVQGYVVGSADALSLAMNPGRVPPRLEASQARHGTVSGWIYDPPDSEATKHWITKYCKENPLSRITEASFELVGELVARSK